MRFLKEAICCQTIEGNDGGISISKQTNPCFVGEIIRERIADYTARGKQSEPPAGMVFMLTGGVCLVILHHSDSVLMPDVPALLKQHFPEDDISAVKADVPSEVFHKDVWSIEHACTIVLDPLEYTEERPKDRPFFRDLEGAQVSKRSRWKHQFSGKKRR